MPSISLSELQEVSKKSDEPTSISLGDLNALQRVEEPVFDDGVVEIIGLGMRLTNVKE